MGAWVARQSSSPASPPLPPSHALQDQLPASAKALIIVAAGAWKSGTLAVTAKSLDRAWRDAGRGSAIMAGWLLTTHTQDTPKALTRACVGPENGALSSSFLAAVVTCMLETGAVRADCGNGQALVEAAGHGHTEVVQVLLGWPLHAPHADSRDQVRNWWRQQPTRWPTAMQPSVSCC